MNKRIHDHERHKLYPNMSASGIIKYLCAHTSRNVNCILHRLCLKVYVAGRRGGGWLGGGMDHEERVQMASPPKVAYKNPLHRSCSTCCEKHQSTMIQVTYCLVWQPTDT